VVLANQVTRGVAFLKQAVTEEKMAMHYFTILGQSSDRAQAAAKTTEEAEVATRTEYEMLIKRLTSASQAAKVVGSARAVVQRERAEAEHVMARFQVANRMALASP